MTIWITFPCAKKVDQIALRRGMRRLDGRTPEADVERQRDILNWIAA